MEPRSILIGVQITWDVLFENVRTSQNALNNALMTTLSSLLTREEIWFQINGIYMF